MWRGTGPSRGSCVDEDATLEGALLAAASSRGPAANQPAEPFLKSGARYKVSLKP